MTTPAKPRKFKPAAVVPEVGRIKSICSGTSEVFKLDPRIIERETGFNSRFDFGDIGALMDEILAAGEVLQALLIRKEGNRILLVDGDRRLTAVTNLITEGRWPEDPNHPGYPLPIPCRSEGKNVSPVDRKFAMLSLNNGKPFSLLEKAFTYRDILELEDTIPDAEIARRTGETKQAVSNALTLIRKAGTGLIDIIKDGKLSATTALEIAKTHEDHKAQLTAAKDAIATAKDAGRNHATPKDLPAKEPTLKKIEAEWQIIQGEDNFSGKAATDGSTVKATGCKWGIRKIEIRYAYHKPSKSWYAGFLFDAGKNDTLMQPTSAMRDGFHAADPAILSEWPALFARAKEYATGHKDEKSILLYLDVLGSRLQAVTTFGNPADSDNDSNVIIPDLEDEDPSDPSDLSDPSDSKSKDAPADPGAIDRIKNTNTSGGGGGGGGGPFGMSSAKIEKRLEAVDAMFDELNKDACNADRWDSMELLIDYINGSHTVATLKKHLLNK